MSYNCDTFKIKVIDDLKIPVKSLYAYEGWEFDRKDDEFGESRFTNCETELSGVVSDGILSVHYINCSGEGSESVMNNVLEPAFEQSTGILTAICVWEGGDSVNKLHVENGKVDWIELEL